MMKRVALNRPLGLLLLAAFFALTTAFAEVAILLFRRHVLGYLIWSSADVIWMTPLAYLFFFMFPAAALVTIALVLPKWITPPRAAALLAFPSALVILIVLLGGSLHLYAHLVLALALATAFFRFAQSSPDRFSAMVRRGTPWMLALVLALVLIVPGGRVLRRRSAIASLPRAAGAPNIILVIWDTVRASNLSLYGYNRSTTPNLERLAGQAIVFDRAYSTAPWTLASHAGMFTGRLTQQLSTGWRSPLDDTYPTVAEVLKKRGYTTAGFVGNLIAAGGESGLSRGFLQYHDFEVSPKTIMLHSLVGQRVRRFKPFNRGPLRTYPVKLAPAVSDEFLSWLNNQGEHPFFAFLNYYDAHDHYYAPPDLRKQFHSGKGVIDRYDAAIANLDRQLPRLFRELDQRGLRENTLVILASDHGELFGEKGLNQHGNSLYSQLLHIPLVVWLPSRQAERISYAVSLRDLPATLVDLSRTTSSVTFPGKSLASLWRSNASFSMPDTLVAGVPKGIGTAPREPVSRGNMSSVVAGNYHYILNGDGEEELYDVVRDPAEDVNRVRDAAARDALTQLRASLFARIPSGWTPVLPQARADAAPTR